MKINKDTAVYMSFAQNPGNQGAKVYNAFFEKLSLNAIYIPRKSFDPKNIANTIRELELRGASLSMPLKQSILPFLDEMSSEAAEIKSVNTVINLNGKLVGYNSDALGFFKVIDDLSFKTVCIYGAGGVVPSILWALKKKGISFQNICVQTRRPDMAMAFAKEHQISSVTFPEYDLLINATPSGHSSADAILKLCSKTKILVDLNAAGIPESLAQVASELKLPAISGQKMFLYQFQKQFEIYHGIKLDLNEIENILK